MFLNNSRQKFSYYFLFKQIRVHYSLLKQAASFTLVVIFCLLEAPWTTAAFTPSPQPGNASFFIENSVGQTWSITKIEELLKLEQKSFNTINEFSRLENIRILGFNNAGDSAKRYADATMEYFLIFTEYFKTK